jgi:hemolysin D
MNILILKAQAWSEIFSRYRKVWAAAWRVRKNNDEMRRSIEEAEFLPAALAVQETPVHPLPRIAMYLLVSIIVLALIGSYIFKIDVIVSAPGQIISTGQKKSIQALESSVVKKIYVNEGELVKAGDVLLELYVPGFQTDSEKINIEILNSKNENNQNSKFLEYINNNNINPTGLEKNNLLNSKVVEYEAKINRILAELESKKSELEATKRQAQKFSEALPSIEQKLNDYKELEQKGYIPKHAVLDQQQLLTDTKAELDIQQSKINDANSQIKQTQLTLESYRSELKRTTLEQIRDADTKLKLNSQELKKTTNRDTSLFIKAPVDGYVHQLVSNTLGGVVAATQTMMYIVPTDDLLEVEIKLENKDVGRLKQGMDAQVKIDTFPFTKYGTVNGRLRVISADAIVDEKKGLLYSARVSLLSKSITSRGRENKLSTGMTTVVELNVGKRRVIEYFLDPFKKNMSESLREW